MHKMQPETREAGYPPPAKATNNKTHKQTGAQFVVYDKQFIWFSRKENKKIGWRNTQVSFNRMSRMFISVKDHSDLDLFNRRKRSHVSVRRLELF